VRKIEIIKAIRRISSTIFFSVLNIMPSKKASKKQTVKRHFHLVSPNGKTLGTFSGSKPYQAAKKAETSLAREKGTNGKQKIRLVESTQGSAKKEYNYVGHRVKNPAEASFGKGKNARTINFEYISKVKKDRSA
jgi:hypothetical protein